MQSYLDGKYLSGPAVDDDGRFKDERGEYHASRIGSCPRQWAWRFTKGHEPESSPYFELGDYFETIYGDALKAEYGEDRVVRDVNAKIEYDEFSVVGESDWVVLKDGYIAPPPTEIRYDVENETRLAMVDGALEAADMIDFVIETKTIKAISWVDDYEIDPMYEYQVATYMLAFGCPGQISFMERNDLSERVIPYDRDAAREHDIYLRAKRQHELIADDNDTVPPATPPKKKHCDPDWCQYRDQCEAVGGQRWDY